jgi:hypothetical protein
MMKRIGRHPGAAGFGETSDDEVKREVRSDISAIGPKARAVAKLLDA